MILVNVSPMIAKQKGKKEAYHIIKDSSKPCDTLMKILN
jgi:hypothetical protein